MSETPKSRRWEDVDPVVTKAMSRVRSKNTGPEMTVRRLVHSMGYRFRLHRKDLPGTPDLVFPGRRKVIFVNGCFWHGHDAPECRRARTPKSRKEFWTAKVARNKTRDARSSDALETAGWGILTVWECETAALQDRNKLAETLRRFLG